MVVDQDSTNQLQPTKVRSELDSENHIELTKEEREAKKSLREIIDKLTTVLNKLKKQQEDISIQNSKEQQFHIVSYCQFLSAICIIGARNFIFW